MEFQIIDFGYPMEIEYFDFYKNQFELCFWNMCNTIQYQYRFQNNNDIPFIVGITTYGKVAVWKNNGYRVELTDWRAAEIKQILNGGKFMSQSLEIQHRINNLMRQYYYRYHIIPIHSKAHLVINFIEETLFDGTLDKVHDDRLIKYHYAGMPHRLHISLSWKFQDYQTYLWFDEKMINDVFNRFYGAHPETKTDFIIRIDAENKKYELALYRQGLKEPVVIPESAYQLIVFKNKFEDYRSENYNQPRGAWIW